MELRKRIGVLLIVIGLLLLLIFLICYKKPDKGGQVAVSGSDLFDLPDAEITEMSDSKSEAYIQKSGRSDNTAQYYDNITGSAPATVVDPMESVGAETKKTQSQTKPVTQQDLFGDSGETTRPKASSSSSTNPYRETAQQREARHQKRREEAIELAERMSGTEEPTGPEEPERISIPTSTASHHGVISSIGGGIEGGVSSLGSENGTVLDETHPYRCVFLSGEKLKNGQRVAVRLLEDMYVGSYLVPKNTHLMAYVKIGSRLEMEVNSIEMNGQIVPLGFDAYDTDGTKGIYCPEAGEGKRTVKTSGLGVVGSAVGGRVGRIAGELVNTGVSLAQTASGERTVSVPAGYTFFLVKRMEP